MEVDEKGTRGEVEELGECGNGWPVVLSGGNGGKLIGGNERRN